MVGIIFALLMVLGGVFYLLRLRGLGHGSDGLDDDMIRNIETTGRLEVDDPLDLEQIRDEEVRFWEESWDEPEEM